MPEATTSARAGRSRRPQWAGGCRVHHGTQACPGRAGRTADYRRGVGGGLPGHPERQTGRRDRDLPADWRGPAVPAERYPASADHRRFRPGLRALGREAGQVARYFTVTTIPPGTLLTREMVATTGTSVAGRAVLGLALKDGQLPRGLQDGDHIDIYQVSDAQETCPGGSGGTLAADAVVLALGAPSATSGSTATADVEVAVNPSDACRSPVTPRTGRGHRGAARRGPGCRPPPRRRGWVQAG